MKKRHFQNCLSKEKKTFEANVKKFKKFIEMEHESEQQNFESVSVISECVISDPLASPPEAVSPDPLASTSSATASVKDVVSPNSKNIRILATKPVLPRATYALYPVLKLNSTQMPPKNENVLSILQQLVQGQKDLNARLDKIEENQHKLLSNQTILSNGQGAIAAYQQEVADKLVKIEQSSVSKAEMMATSKLLMEAKIIIKKVEESVCRMTGETIDNNIYEVASMLPLNSIGAVQEIEDNLQDPEFAKAMTTYLYKMKGSTEDIGCVIRGIITDDLLSSYNWDGRWEKHALGKLSLFNKTLRDIFKNQGCINFEKSIRKAVERSHHRQHQKKYTNTKNC